MSKAHDEEAYDPKTAPEAYKGDLDGPESDSIIVRDAPVSVGVNQGKWFEVGWHMCTSVAGPALLGLPFAMSLLGWPAGCIALILGYFVTAYTSGVIASLHEWDGKPHIRYRDLAESIYGTWRGKAVVWPCQWANLIGGNISIYIQAGLSIKGIDVLAHADGNATLSLTEWIAVMGGIAMIFTQLPTFHSLRYINGIAMVSTYMFSVLAIIISFWQWYEFKEVFESQGKDYGVHGAEPGKLFNLFNGIVIMSFAYGNTIIPEIQATARKPTDRTMYKAIGVLYTLLAFTYLPVAWIGYWAYGSLLSADGGSFLPSFQANYPNPAGMDGGPRPRWLIIWLLALTCLNALIGIQLYNQPVLEVIETYFIYTKSREIWNFRNWFLRTCLRCFYIFLCAFVAALFPYFGDILGLIGAIGITPIDFVLPCVMHLSVRKPKGLLLFVDIFIICLYGCIGTLGAIAAVRGIVVDAQEYSVFANL